MSTAPDIVSALTELGFSLNEGRAYEALLRWGPQTGYEVGQRAQVPRSAVYSALRRLVSAGAARSIAGSPERFVAAPPETLLALLRKRFDSQAGTLESAIAALDVSLEVPDAFSVRGYERVMEEAERLSRTAEERLLLSGWPRELETLREALAEASKRGVSIVIFSHAHLPSDLAGTHFGYGLDEKALEAFWKHRLVVVADDRRTLIGATEQAASDNAVISETEAIAELATSQIALDITLLAQRHHWDAQGAMAKLLGDRVGRLDTLLGKGERPELGIEHSCAEE
jgi:sugar-specific transcriptional regulator TrmB